MSGRFRTKKSHVTIHADWWDADEAVVIRRFSFGDRERVNELMCKVSPFTGAGEPEMTMDMGMVNRASLIVGIVSWNMRDEDGQAVALSQETIDQLTEEDADFILAEIARVNPKSEHERGGK